MADKPNNRLILYAVVAIVIVVIVAAAAAYVLSNNASAKEPTIKASVSKDCTITPWVVGQQKGFFNQSGVKFEDVGEISSPQRSAALVSGQIQVLDMDPQGLIDLKKAGVPVTAVAQSGDEPTDGDVLKEHMHWLVLQNSPFYNASDIHTFAVQNHRKVKIGVAALGICADLQNNAWLRENGISQDEFEYVIIPDPNAMQALKQGEIDIAVLHPPFYFAAEQYPDYRILTVSSKAFKEASGTTLLVFQDQFIKDHPDLVRNFIKGYKDAERWSNNNREESANLTAAAIGLDKAAAHYYSQTGAINDTQLQYWIDSMVADGLIKQGEFKPSDLYTTEFSDTWK